ncbi:MAG TPA: phosphonate C-P lyase system protein PhnH [Devosiaceae bacterium]|jgi:alpha-D-ribose 1-methylphosphonate 5-triphosphate synthase subunit PhnH|nr:phosphonate C-P lyase system protein PhnH [Devosiaceae bacterium]
MSVAINTTDLKPAFAQPIFDSQASFRRILDALAYAGRTETLDRLSDVPAPLNTATTAAILTLLDFETPVWLDVEHDSAAANYIRFHASAPLSKAKDEARFAIVTRPSEMPSLAAFFAGEDKYPETSCTLIIQVPSLTEGPATRWTGPGIDGETTVHIAGLPELFWREWDDNHGLYPMGVDVIFSAGSEIIGLPRGVKVEE